MDQLEEKNDGNRIAIAVFIVATTLAILTTKIYIPSILILPVGTLLVGLIITSMLAFLFLLAKGYELRYNKKKINLIDKYNYVLYNAAMTAYVIVMAIILLGFAYKSMSELSKAGNVWGTVGVVVLFMVIIGLINGRDIKELTIAGMKMLHKKYKK